MLFRNLGILGKRFAQAFLPSNIGGLQLWLDATDLSTITKDGSDYVSVWTDKSANAYSFEQATGANQPQYVSTGFGTESKGYLSFDGVDDFMSLASNSNIQLQTMTIFVVDKVTALGNFDGIIDKWNNTSKGYMLDYQSAGNIGKPRLTAGGTSIASTIDVIYTNALIVVRITGSTDSFIEVNGTRTTGALDTTPTNADDLYIGGGDNASTFKPPNQFVEFIVYNQALTDTQVTQVTNYLNNKYGIY